MSLYMGRNETSHAVTEALELLRKYPFQWLSYNPNDPLANSVVTYLKKQGKIVINRFHQFQAAPKHKPNPAPGIAERSKKLHKIRKVFVKDMNAAKRNGNRVREDYMIRKISKLDRILFAQPGNTMRAKLRNAKSGKTTFKKLPVGQMFVFASDREGGIHSPGVKGPWIKTSPRKYIYPGAAKKYQHTVGTINVEVYPESRK
jgi:hypothetical protein